MIDFELRDVVRNSFREETVEGIDSIIFTVTPEVGIVGNTYPFFLNNAKQIQVICPISMEGTDMKAQVQTEALAFVAANFPSI